MKKTTQKALLLLVTCFALSWQASAQILSEGFDAVAIPTGWTQETVSGTALWKGVTANGNSTIEPRTGSHMAEFRTTSTGNKTKLVSPEIDITTVTNPTLTFYYANTNWFGDVDQLRLFYKTSATGEWTQFGDAYTAEQTSWTEVSLVLPEPSATYYIAFEGFSNFARGINIDDVLVDAGPDCTIAVVDSSTVVADCDNDQYSIDVEISEVGDGTFISDGTNTFPMILGTVTAGPYANGSTQTLTVEHSDSACEFTLDTFTYSCPPENDECANAIALTVNADLDCAVITAGTTTNATNSGNTGSTCNGTANDDVWYSFVATQSVHQIKITNVVGSTTDLFHAVYDATLGCGTLGAALVCSDPNTSTVNGLTVGNTYLVQVYTYSAATGNSVDFDICVGTPPAPPANDECSDAIALTVNMDYDCLVKTSATTSSATNSGNTGSTCSGTANDDVWFSFVATSTEHRVSLTNVTGTVTDMYHAIYDATPGCGTLGAALKCSDNDTSNTTSFVVGNTYLVQVYTYTSSTSNSVNFDICVGTPPTCFPVTGIATAFDAPDTFNITWSAPTAGTTPEAYNWEVVPNGNIQGDGVIDSGIATTGAASVTGLAMDTLYDVYIQTDCGSGDTSNYAGPFTFNTGHCIIAPGTSDATYISNFSTTGGVENISNLTSGFSTDNYGDYFGDPGVSVAPEDTFSFDATIVGGTAGFAIWVDWNGDFAFDPATEVVYNTTTYLNGPFTGTITVPEGTPNGDYRMRVMTDWNRSNPTNFPCALNSGRGEVEDYKVTVDAALSIADVSQTSFTYFPNPVTNQFVLKAQQNIETVAVFNMLGQEVLNVKPNTNTSEINMSSLNSGAYFVKVTIDNTTKTIKILKN